jgi:hypothetical protein
MALLWANARNGISVSTPRKRFKPLNQKDSDPAANWHGV